MKITHTHGNTFKVVFLRGGAEELDQLRNPSLPPVAVVLCIIVEATIARHLKPLIHEECLCVSQWWIQPLSWPPCLRICLLHCGLLTSDSTSCWNTSCVSQTKSRCLVGCLTQTQTSVIKGESQCLNHSVWIIINDIQMYSLKKV